MKQINRSPSYLVRNAHSYCFRLAIPKDLQTLVGKRELRYSLGTGYIGQAKNKSRYIASQVQLPAIIKIIIQICRRLRICQ